MGVQVDVPKIASLMGYDANELDAMMMAKYGGMQNNLTLLMNSNTSTDGSQVGNPEKAIQDKSIVQVYLMNMTNKEETIW